MKVDCIERDNDNIYILDRYLHILANSTGFLQVREYTEILNLYTVITVIYSNILLYCYRLYIV